MEYDYWKLRKRIHDTYGAQRVFAKALMMSERSMSAKLNNESYFTQNEISMAIDLLKIEPTEIANYFFTRKVQVL
jgi:hypothetical protein